MTDLEITKLCAEAMGLEFVEASYPFFRTVDKVRGVPVNLKFAPLHDDAQAMALVKKFKLNIDGCFFERGDFATPNTWQAFTQDNEPHFFGINADLNRAICECVAKMRAEMQAVVSDARLRKRSDNATGQVKKESA